MSITITMGFLFFYLISATYYDLREYRIPNQLILFGLGTSLPYQLFNKGWYGFVWWGMGILVPFILLFILYLFHMIGAGDIKLFSAVGGFLGIYQVIQVIILAFFIGAVMSIIQMIRFRNFGYRMQYLANYIHTLVREKKITPYFNLNVVDRGAVIPFTMAIAISVFIVALTIQVR